MNHPADPYDVFPIHLQLPCLDDRPSAKGFHFTGQGFSAGCIEGTTLAGYCSHMIRG
jgi:hypothetical protein